MNQFPGATGDHQSSQDEQVRRLLHDAVVGIDPRDPLGALGAIHTRTEVSSMQHRRSWFFGAAAAAAAVAATVVAVAVVTGDGTTGERDPGFAAPTDSATSGPDPTPSADASPSEPASRTTTVPVYYVGKTSRGLRLFREFHEVEAAGDQLTAALGEAVATAPQDADYRTDWPGGTVVAGAGFDGVGSDGQISLTLRNDGTGLRERPAGMTAEEAGLAVEQLIYTAQAVTQTRASVQFFLERSGSGDDRTDQLLGVPVSEPVSEGDPVDVLAQVWIIEPSEGMEVTAPFEVSGLAAAFEATVVWELRDAGGTVVKSDFTTAEECCTMAPYSFEVDVPPGEYTLVVQDTDASGGEGPGPWVDTKSITVTR